jgi:hypothetical protein
MANVVNFRVRAQQRSASVISQSETVFASGIAPVPTSPVADLPSTATKEMRNAILLLDLAALHAREISMRICDPDARKAFETHIASIEYALQIVREKTS